MNRLAITTAALATFISLVAVPCHAMTIFVSNEKDNTITVIDGDTMEIASALGRRHHAVASFGGRRW